MSRTRAAAVLIGFILMNLTVVPAVWIALRLRLKAHVPLLYLYHRSLCWLMGVRVTVTGEPIKGGLMLANHMGWLDIPVLSITCALSFIAKSEVNSWPMFGFLSRLQRTIFVRRSERGKAREDSEQIRRRLLAGERLVIFAEGTSSLCQEKADLQPGHAGNGQQTDNQRFTNLPFHLDRSTKRINPGPLQYWSGLPSSGPKVVACPYGE